MKQSSVACDPTQGIGYCVPGIPDLMALLAKLDVIHEHGLDSDNDMRRPPIELLREM